MEEKNILIVDDEQFIRDLYSQAFSRAGYKVKTAGSAEEALDILRKDKYLVMFLDLNLPGMNGIDLCRQIRKNYPMAITYAVTGNASLFELSDCRDAGFEDYFIKPVKLSVLFEAADSAFKKLERWKNNNSSSKLHSK
ncbi:MAG: response regulator [Proteobacteria bacterium]|nr:response regulator [Pseudomonadota bacterium]MBU4010224.1 response regulator [Pseudomonadota bacterium]